MRKIPSLHRLNIAPGEDTGTGELPRRLGVLDATNITIGVVIGSAIFLVPGEIARNLHSPGQILGTWLAVGILSFFGALACAELGAMLPETGGQYVYLREAYGPLCGFLYGWTMLVVVESGGIATLAAGFAIYLGYFVPLTAVLAKVAAAGLIAVLTGVNYVGIRQGVWTQNALTFLKVAGLSILIGAAFYAPAHAPVGGAAAVPGTLHGFGIAMVACLWAYEGWNTVTFVAGEVKDPGRNLTISLAWGMAVIIALYMLANVAYMRVLALPEIAATERVAGVVADRTLGRAGGVLFALIVLVSIGGSINGSILAIPRGYFAQARDGLFFRGFAQVHPRFQTPGRAILLSSGWSTVLALSGSYETLYSYVVFSAWIFYGLTVLGVMVLRRKMPGLARPYRMFGYPWTPLAFGAVAFWFVGYTLWTDFRSSAMGLCLVGAGVPVYWAWRRSFHL